MHGKDYIQKITTHDASSHAAYITGSAFELWYMYHRTIQHIFASFSPHHFEFPLPLTDCPVDPMVGYISKSHLHQNGFKWQGPNVLFTDFQGLEF